MLAGVSRTQQKYRLDFHLIWQLLWHSLASIGCKMLNLLQVVLQLAR